MIKFAPASQMSQSAVVPSAGRAKPFQMELGQNDRMAGSMPVWDSVKSFTENIADPGQVSGKDTSFGFKDVLDIVNPLQHIPVVSNLYQSATGDTIGSIAKIVGGAVFGGPIGALVSAGMVAYQAAKESEQSGYIDNLNNLGTTVALADLRQGYKPYNV